MRNAWKLGLAWAAVGLLLATAGCGSSEQGNSDVKPAAINGSSEGAANTSSPSVDAANKPIAVQPAESIPDPLHPVVAIETSLGTITVALDGDKAPLTVANFLTYVENGDYDQTIFHQVFENYVILGGMFTGDLVEKPTRPPVRNEAHNGLKNTRGTIAMARQADVIDSATSQFYLNVADNAMLDHMDQSGPDKYGYCVFGKVVEGMEVVDRIGSVEVKDTQDFERIPVQTVLIKSIRKIR